MRWASWPRRTLWPTRDGWWCLGITVGLGFAAMNTGNNLLYVLVSMLLSLVIVSGVLSEQTMRGLQFSPILPDEVYAGRAAVLGVHVVNRKRWCASYAITVEALDTGGPRASVGIPRLDAGAQSLVTWETTFPRRGRRPFPRLRVITRFPFGLFVKAAHVDVGRDVVVFPALRALARARVRQLAGGDAPARGRGRGSELHQLREYRTGDDPRLIHWRSSAKTSELVVRELAGDAAADARLVLEGTGVDRDRLETGLADAATLATHLLRAGGAVEVVAPAAVVGPGRGHDHRRRLLTALALYDPAGDPVVPRPRGRIVREIRVSIG